MLFRNAVFGLVILIALATWASPPAFSAEEGPVEQAIAKLFAAMDDFQAGRTEKAANELRKVLRLFEKKEFTHGRFMVHLSLARVYRARAEYEKALVELNKAKEMMSRARKIRGEGLALMRIAEVEMDRGNFDESEDLLKKSLADMKAMGDETLLAPINVRLARVMIIEGDYTSARGLLNQALEISRRRGDAANAAKALKQLGEIERLVSNYPESLSRLKEALDISRAANLDGLSYDIVIQRALTLRDQGLPAEARRLLEESAEHFSSVHDSRDYARSQIYLASVLLQMGLVDEAAQILPKAIKESKRHKALLDEAVGLLIQGKIEYAGGALSRASKTLTQAVKQFDALTADHGEIAALIAQAKVQAAQGMPFAAQHTTRHALEAAGRLGARLPKAEALLERGRTLSEAGDFLASLERIEKALRIFTELKNNDGRVHCLLGLANAQMNLGFTIPAQDALEAVAKLPESRRDLGIIGEVWLLKAQLSALKGADKKALEELAQAEAALGKLSSPLKEARLMETRAQVVTARRDYAQALHILEEAGELYEKVESPGGILGCLEQMFRIALYRNDTTLADSIVRRGFRISRTEAAGASKDHSSDIEMFRARVTAMRARLEQERGSPGKAAPLLAGSIDAAVKTRDHRHLLRFRHLMFWILMEQERYDQASAMLKTLGISKGWMFEYAGGMNLAKEGKLEAALQRLEKAMSELRAEELQKGLWAVHPDETRRRERLYEDYLDMTPATVEVDTGENQRARKAWENAQILKMRRTLYDLRATGVYGFPGAPRATLSRLKTLQFKLMNASKRKGLPSITGPAGDPKTESSRESVEKVTKELGDLVTKLSQENPLCVRFIKGRPPKVEQVQAALSKDQLYLSLLLTRGKLRTFLIGKDLFTAAGATATPKEIAGLAAAVTRDVSNPYGKSLNKAAADLWVVLMGKSAEKVSNVRELVIEPDGFLTLFPFEALVTGESKESSQEKPSRPVLMDSTQVVRTTSAFRFHGNSSGRPSSSPNSISVFAGPILPSLDHDDKGKKGRTTWVYVEWKKRLSRLQASHSSRTAEQGARIAELFGQKGELVSGDLATTRALLEEGLGHYPLIHILCPVMIPENPAGRTHQPFILMSPESHHHGTGVCGLGKLSGKRHSELLITLGQLDLPRQDSHRGLLLLLEVLGFSGARSVLLPLWPSDRQGEGESETFMKGLYLALREGAGLLSAVNRARREVSESGTRPSRFIPVRFALF